MTDATDALGAGRRPTRVVFLALIRMYGDCSESLFARFHCSPPNRAIK